MRRLLRTARHAGSVRDRALLALLCGTGLRLAETAALDVADVPTTESTGAVHVRAGKGERPRTVPLPVDARTQLRRWLSEREQHPAGRPGEPALWLGRRGRLSPRQLQRVVTALGAGAGLEVSPHTLRHTAATRWLRAGVDVVVVAGLLGHSSLDTTRTYTRPSDHDPTQQTPISQRTRPPTQVQGPPASAPDRARLQEIAMITRTGRRPAIRILLACRRSTR